MEVRVPGEVILPEWLATKYGRHQHRPGEVLVKGWQDNEIDFWVRWLCGNIAAGGYSPVMERPTLAKCRKCVEKGSR